MALLYSHHSSISTLVYLQPSLFSLIIMALSIRLQNPIYICIGTIALLQERWLSSKCTDS
ncbi:hypothetical protein PanWU01x14_033170 [Parasponia andersonii]|uniref:Uncharacterized protein n=1 Tax=Parasponia andersonii TaxID=3476 RepID=A0A2P5DTL0_PARAD|nr:hypothetical protein PanWU01x14_033170 [Parasponia andersonii]